MRPPPRPDAPLATGGRHPGGPPRERQRTLHPGHTTGRRAARRGSSLIAAIAVTLVLLAAATGCGTGGGRAADDVGDRLDLPDGGAEPTTPVTDLPPVPGGPATARVEWTEGRGTSSAELDDTPSGCRVAPGAGGSILVVDLGDPAVAGGARSADLLHLEVGPLARSDGSPPGGDGGYLATVQRLDLVISGGDPPDGGEAVGTIASVDADLGHLRLPLADGSVAITCAP